MSAFSLGVASRLNSPLSDGTSIYITRDLGEALERYEKYKFDKMIYVIAAQQNFHCQQFFKMLELLGYEWADRLEHVNFGERNPISSLDIY